MIEYPWMLGNIYVLLKSDVERTKRSPDKTSNNFRSILPSLKST